MKGQGNEDGKAGCRMGSDLIREIRMGPTEKVLCEPRFRGEERYRPDHLREEHQLARQMEQNVPRLGMAHT